MNLFETRNRVPEEFLVYKSKGANPTHKILIFTKFQHFWPFSYTFTHLEHSKSFQKAPGASCVLSQPLRRLYFTHKVLEASKAPQKNAYKQKAPALESYIDFFKF